MSKTLTINISHSVGRAEARRRLESGFAKIRDQIGGKNVAFQERWEADSLFFDAAAFGQKIDGRVDVEEDHVLIEVVLPWVLASIAEKMQRRIHSTATLLLEKK